MRCVYVFIGPLLPVQDLAVKNSRNLSHFVSVEKYFASSVFRFSQQFLVFHCLSHYKWYCLRLLAMAIDYCSQSCCYCSNCCLHRRRYHLCWPVASSSSSSNHCWYLIPHYTNCFDFVHFVPIVTNVPYCLIHHSPAAAAYPITIQRPVNQTINLRLSLITKITLSIKEHYLINR